MSTNGPLMPKATAVWLVDNTSLTFDQIADFCGMHILEIKGIADGDVAQGIRGKNPVTAGELTREAISEAEGDADARLKVSKSKVKIPEIKAKKRPRYTPVSRRQDRPNAVVWLLRHHPELKDSQIIRLVGTTKPTIQQIRDRTHWNSANLVPQDPVTLGLCKQTDLDLEVEKATERRAKERAAAGLPPLEVGETLLPTAETTDYGLPSGPGDFTAMPPPGQTEQPEISADAVFANVQPAGPDAEEVENQEEADRVFAKLQEMSSGGEEAAESEQPSDAGFDEINKDA
ncbi:MAG: cell cycle transcriptional regulator TrcR [Pseudomonadota bacterium]